MGGGRKYADTNHCRIEGDVQIGHGTFLHPRCELIASSGSSITVGDNTIIEELVSVRCGRLPDSSSLPPHAPPQVFAGAAKRGVRVRPGGWSLYYGQLDWELFYGGDDGED
eukprot:328637-Hanusia_phi.AAC.1